MATHQIMGSGGLDVDMVSGKPRPKDPEAKKAEALARYRETVQESIALAAELQDSPVLKVLLEKYQNRLIHLANQDPECQALTSIIGSFRHKLEVATIEAEKMVRRVMGPQMSSFIQEEPQAASEEIPA